MWIIFKELSYSADSSYNLLMIRFLGQPRTSEKIHHLIGFTILELLIVIAIIGILSAIVFSELGSKPLAKARDARRIADFREFELALEQFHIQYGVYPCGDHDLGTYSGDSSLSIPFLDGGPTGNCSNAPTFGVYTAGYYPRSFPTDPLNSGGHLYRYDVSTDRQRYILYTRMEQTMAIMQTDGGSCANVYERGPGIGILAPYLPQFGVNCN